jgi:hypothetical protein
MSFQLVTQLFFLHRDKRLNLLQKTQYKFSAFLASTPDPISPSFVNTHTIKANFQRSKEQKSKIARNLFCLHLSPSIRF